jgi:methanogenic corrinoid protein MtbC1
LRDFLASIEKKQNDIIGNVAQLQTTVAQMQTTVAQLELTLRNIIREEIQHAIKNDFKKQIIDLLKFGADNW